MDRREYVCNQMYKQHALLRRGSWTDADKLEYMELNIAPYSRYWRMGMKKALKHAIKLLREEEAKADRKTENSSEKPNNCEHITEDGVTCAKYPACDDCPDNPLNKVKGSEDEVCGTCKYNRRDWTNPNNSDFYCSNERSDFYGDNTEYKTTCEEWEGKE